jgi:hypothetical protein
MEDDERARLEHTPLRDVLLVNTQTIYGEAAPPRRATRLPGAPSHSTGLPSASTFTSDVLFPSVTCPS